VWGVRQSGGTSHHLADGQHYLVGVAAYNGDGTSNGFGKMVTPGSVPSAPREVHAVGGPGSLTLIWTGPKSDGGFRVTHYRIQYATCSPAASTCKTHTVRVSGYRHQIVIHHLAANTTYRVRVAGQNKRGYGHPSRVIRARTT
jgi:hypothetical protein